MKSLKTGKEYSANAFRHLIGYFKTTEEVVGEQEIDQMWSQLKQQMHETRPEKKKKRSFILYAGIISVAASLLGIVWLSQSVGQEESRQLDSFIAQMESMDSLSVTDEIQLVVDPKRIISIGKGSVVSYGKNGALSVDKQQIENESQAQEVYNQLIVPKGKHTQLMLADGSTLHVNAGSKVIYPRYFTGDKREIYVDGEIYIDVVHDEAKPFVVKTSTFSVEVLGTAFNVNAYKNAKTSEVALLRGSVAIAGVDRQTTRLVPNQLAQVESGKVIKTQRVDAAGYIAWINGALLLNNQNMESILSKLSVYYGVSISPDEEVKPLILQGAIDLSVPLVDVLERISRIVPIQFEKTANGYHLQMKDNVSPF